MPITVVKFYCEADGSVPVLTWLDQIHARDRRAYAKCLAAIERLAQSGHELRRPTADFLRDGIYELRVGVGNVHYRIVYFFHGRNVALLAHGLTKEQAIPKADLQRAIERKARFEANPRRHTFEE